MEPFYLLVLYIVTSEETVDNLVPTVDNGAKVIEGSMDGAEVVLATVQQDVTIMLATAHVTDADTVCHNDRAFSIACYVASVQAKQSEVCLRLPS